MKTNILIKAGMFIVGLMMLYSSLIFAQKTQTREEREVSFIVNFYTKMQELETSRQVHILSVDEGEGTLYLDDMFLEIIKNKENVSFYTTTLEIGKKTFHQPQVAVRSLRVHTIQIFESLDISSSELEELALRHLILANKLNKWKWGFPENALSPVPTFFLARFEHFFTPFERAIQQRNAIWKPVLIFDYYPREKKLFLKYATVEIIVSPSGDVLMIPGTIERIIAEQNLDALKNAADFDGAAARFSQEAFEIISSENLKKN